MNLFFEGFNSVCLNADQANTKTSASPLGNFSITVSDSCSSTSTPPDS